MRYLFMDKRIMTEIDNAVQNVLNEMGYNGFGKVSTDDIVAAVSKITNSTIDSYYVPFSEIKEECKDFGAMMRVTKDKEESNQKVTILLNDEKDIKFRRFSLIHELGHLVIDRHTTVVDDKNYKLSAHIQYNITNFPEEFYSNNKVLLNEQEANIFALKVLMPEETFKSKLMNENDSLEDIASYFGVSEEAVRSRILLMTNKNNITG